MPYTNDPANVTTDAIRALIRDTSTSTAVNLLTDNEVAWLEADYPNVYYAAAAGADMIASGKGDAVFQKKVGDLALSMGAPKAGIAEQYRMLAARLRMTAASRGVKPYTGGISVSDKDTQRADTDWDQPAAAIGMNDYANSSTGGVMHF